MAAEITMTIDIDEKRISRLREKAKKIGIEIEDDQEIFDNAYALFEWALGEMEKGAFVAAVYKPEKRFVEPVLPFMQKKGRNLQ